MRVRVCVCACACACVSVRVCTCVSVCACACVRACVCVCVHMFVHVVRLCRCCCMLASLNSCIITECQCSANCTILWGQTKVCEFCMAASPSSCAPLPHAQPGPLLPAAGGRGLGVKAMAVRGGGSSPLVTWNNNYFSLPPPRNKYIIN